MQVSTAEKLGQILVEREAAKDSKFSRAQESLEKMQRLGVAVRPDYKIRPVDTIGFKLYQQATKKS